MAPRLVQPLPLGHSTGYLDEIHLRGQPGAEALVRPTPLGVQVTYSSLMCIIVYIISVTSMFSRLYGDLKGISFG